MRYMIIFVSFVMCGCSSQKGWHCQRILTGENDYDALRVVYTARDKSNDIEVEILKTNLIHTLSLTVHGQPIPSSENHPGHSLVRITIDDQSFKELASLHAGGQRLKLSPSLQEKIISQLRNGGAVEIELPGYKRTIDASNFPDLVKKIDEPSHFRNPIRLPF